MYDAWRVFFFLFLFLFFSFFFSSCCQSILIHLVTIFWTHSVLLQQLRNIGRNITFCEEMKGGQFTYFWQDQFSVTKNGIEKIRKWKNPFDQGIKQNCIEFWRHGNRSEEIDFNELKERSLKEFMDEFKSQEKRI